MKSVPWKSYFTCDFLCAEPRISLDMSSYMIAENYTLSVCAVLSNVLPMGGTTSDITTMFMLTDGDAGKKVGDGILRNIDDKF